jgi:SAM-dependent methyltransferase
MVKCAYCGAEAEIKHKDMSHPVWKEMVHIDMYECGSCKSLTTYPMPTPEQLSFCYSKYSFDGYPEHKSAAKKTSNQIFWYKDILRIFNFKANEKVQIADVGAGEGLLEEVILSASFDGNIDCFDYHTVPHKIKALNEAHNNIRWHIADLSNKNWMHQEQYDWVFFISVIEHVPDPLKLVNDLISMAKKGGKVCIIGPCVSNMFYSLLKEKWVYMIPGEHLSLPSIKGLDLMMKSLEIQKYYVKKINVSYSLKYIIDSLFKTNAPRLFDIALRLPVGAFSLEITK